MKLLRPTPPTIAWVVGFAILCTGQRPSAGQAAQDPAAQLRPTVHAALPQDVGDYWLVPAAKERSRLREPNLSAAASAYAAGSYAAALDAAERASTDGALGSYALLYRALAQLRMSRAPEADTLFDAVLATKPTGYLADAALIGKAEGAELRADHAAAADIYQKLASEKSIAADDILLRLGRAALAAGDRPRAAEAFLRVYYEFPLSDAATPAGAALASLQDEIVRSGFKRDLGRALILFGAKRYAEARSAFQDFQKQVNGDDREVTDLRIAECDYFLKRYAAARDALEPYLDKASRKAEARFFYSSAVRELGDHDRYVALTKALVADVPDSTWAEEALNNLGTQYLLADQDALAAQTFKEQYAKFPRAQHSERAAWKYGWWAYKSGNYAEAVRVFEAAAADFPRSDYRPPYLYWSARARARMGDRAAADARMRLVYTDYMNSYYGRLARKQLAVQSAAEHDGAGDRVIPASQIAPQEQAPAAAPPPNATTIRALIASDMYDDALSELRYAQKAWGTSPVIEATMAWVYHERGELRRAITTMRRAYPQHLAAGGQGLPAEILQIIFPLTYWDAIRRNAAAHDLDPYVVAALINQESTFDASAKSVANAWGLMQLLPSTGRRLAPAVGVRRFSTPLLTNADINIRMGTLYFSRLVERFGGTYYALASYNAGDSRVAKWKQDRPGLDEDEFIDDIPFPETQNYVKRILGTAEDYRRLYGEDGARPEAPPSVKGFSAKAATAVKASASKKKVSPAKKKATPKKKAAPRKKKRHRR